MSRRLLAVMLLAGAFAGPALADDDQIDADLEACLDGEMSTQGMVECYGAAYEAWDAALNEAYATLMDTLSEEEATALRDAQRAWIRFRDAESAFLASLMTPDRGTIMRITVNAAMTDLVKQRTQALRSLDDSGGEQ